VVVLVADRDLTGSGLRVPFFGAPARLPTGPALLAVRSGAPLLSAVCVVREDGSFEGVIDPPIPVARSGDKRADVERITRAIAARLEYHIRRNPEHWTVFQPLWDD
jgi:phosphatidylinositol dimannoside acyltransferase